MLCAYAISACQSENHKEVSAAKAGARASLPNTNSESQGPKVHKASLNALILAIKSLHNAELPRFEKLAANRQKAFSATELSFEHSIHHENGVTLLIVQGTSIMKQDNETFCTWRNQHVAIINGEQLLATPYNTWGCKRDSLTVTSLVRKGDVLTVHLEDGGIITQDMSKLPALQ